MFICNENADAIWRPCSKQNSNMTSSAQASIGSLNYNMRNSDGIDFEQYSASTAGDLVRLTQVPIYGIPAGAGTDRRIV